MFKCSLEAGYQLYLAKRKKKKKENKQRKISPTKRGVTQSLRLARLSVEATEATAGGGDPEDDPCAML